MAFPPEGSGLVGTSTAHMSGSHGGIPESQPQHPPPHTSRGRNHPESSRQPRHHSNSNHNDGQDPTHVKYHMTSRNASYISMRDSWQKSRLQCGEIVNHSYTQLVIVMLIAINALMMGLATFDWVKNNPDVNTAFELTDTIFLSIFTLELGMQFVFRGWRLVTDGWLVFDLIIIATSWGFAELQIIRAFRIFRALRLITRIKVMQNLVVALFGVMPRIVAIILLLSLVSYIFAVMFTQLFKEIDPEYFGRMDKTLFTLFQIMTLDGWADIARDLMEFQPWSWLPFTVFVVITGFVVVNLIIAVICDAISALHDDEKAKLRGHTVSENGEDESASDQALDVREQLDNLENHVDELAQMQEQTLQTMTALANQLALTNRRLADAAS